MISGLLFVDSSQMSGFVVAGFVDFTVFRFAYTFSGAVEWVGFNDNYVT